LSNEIKSTARTEEEIIGAVPVVVKLGGVEYSIPPLTIKKNREWRKKLGSKLDLTVKKVGLGTKSNNADIASFLSGLKTALLDVPDTIADLLFEYCPDLPRETIEETALETELIAAFREVWKLAFPFGETLNQLMAVVQVATAKK
jgi:hypothetical protein